MLASSVSCARTLATSVRALPRATGSFRTFPANIVVGSRSYAQKKSSEAKEPATPSQAEEPDLAEPVSLSKLVIEQKKYSKDTLQSAAVVMKRRKQQAAREALGGEPLYSEAAQDAKPLPEPPKLTELSHTHPFFERVEDPDWEDDSIEKPVPPKMEKPPRSMSFAELLSKKVKKVNACMFCKQTAPGSLAQATNRGMNVKDPMIYYAPYNDPMNTPLLVQFMTAMGNILPRRYTGTCAKHQRALAKTIKRARHMGFFATKSSNYTIQSPYMTDLGETGKPYDPTAPENLPQREDYRSTEDVPLVVVGGRQ